MTRLAGAAPLGLGGRYESPPRRASGFSAREMVANGTEGGSRQRFVRHLGSPADDWSNNGICCGSRSAE